MNIQFATLLAIGLQTAAVIWWAANIHSRVASLEKRVDSAADQRDRIIKLETILERLEKKIDKLAP